MLKQSNAKKNCVEKTRCLNMLKARAFLKNSKIELIFILCFKNNRFLKFLFFNKITTIANKTNVKNNTVVD